jgi:hypothetical protein
MDSKRFEQIERLYHAALAGTPEKRSALLDQADPEVRREVELLLAQEGSLLDRPAWEGLKDTEAAVGVAGKRVGRYEIGALLGAGGMGEVFRAQDTKLNRPVAIKFLSSEFADAAARHRFQREAQMASFSQPPAYSHRLRHGRVRGAGISSHGVRGWRYAQDLVPVAEAHLAPDYRTAHRRRRRVGRRPRGGHSASRHQAG